jgi:endoglucanase
VNLLSTRRNFVKGAVGGAAALGARLASAMPRNPLPRWRGFNLTYLFQARVQHRPVEIPEDDFLMIQDMGFDFVRIPMDYWFWIDSDWPATGRPKAADVMKIKESGLVMVDRIVELGRKHGIHVNLNFHRAPGFCVNEADLEPFDLWHDKDAEDAFVYHWDVFARRYKDIPSSAVSFNLLNEAPSPRPRGMSEEDYRRVMTRAAEKIQETTPDRTLIIDGFGAGNQVVYEMMPTGIAQSVHAYFPAEVSHYHASWVDHRMEFPYPMWPAMRRDGTGVYNRDVLEEHYAPWGWMVRQGIGVHCGECGAFNRTPHDAFLKWMCEVLDILKSHSIGWALWNFRGSFGLLDSGRDDVNYEDWHGHKLDHQLLTLLQYH